MIEKQHYYCYYCMDSCDTTQVAGEPLCPNCGGRMELKSASDDTVEDNGSSRREQETGKVVNELMRDMQLEEDIIFEPPEHEEIPETFKCRYCAEEVQSEAVKCKHCGEWLTEDVQMREPDEVLVSETIRGDKSSSWRVKLIITVSFIGMLVTSILLTAYYCPHIPSYQEGKDILLSFLSSIF